MLIIANTIREGKVLANKLNGKFSPVVEKIYPDGEKSLLVGTEKKADIVLYTFNKKETFDDQLFNLLSLLSRCGSAARTRLVLPYFPYLRSYPFPKNEADKISLLMGELEKYVKELYLICPHMAVEEIQKCTRLALHGVDIDEALMVCIRKLGHKITLICPDAGFEENIKRIASKMHVSYSMLMKKRISPQEVIVEGDQRTAREIKKKLSEHFVFVDDIISTGSTLLCGAAYLKSLGVRNIHYVAIHDTCRETQGRKIKVHSSNSLIAEEGRVSIDLLPSIARTLGRSGKAKKIVSYSRDFK